MKEKIGVQKTYVLSARADEKVISSYGTPAQCNPLTRHEGHTTVVIRTRERSIQRHGEVRWNIQGRSDTEHGQV